MPTIIKIFNECYLTFISYIAGISHWLTANRDKL